MYRAYNESIFMSNSHTNILQAIICYKIGELSNNVVNFSGNVKSPQKYDHEFDDFLFRVKNDSKQEIIDWLHEDD